MSNEKPNEEMSKYVKVICIMCVIIAAFFCGQIKVDLEVQCAHCAHITQVGEGCSNSLVTNTVSTTSTTIPTNTVSD